MKLTIVLLGLGVCACCAYGMSQIDPQLIPKGLKVITNLKVLPASTCNILYTCAQFSNLRVLCMQHGLR